MWIKICGMTSEAAVATALEQGVDALGFVFAPSVRQLDPVRAAALAAPARGRVACVAVTLHPTQTQVDAILSTFQPDLLQTDQADLMTLRLPPGLMLLPVLRAGVPDADALPGTLPPRILFEGPRSGSGLATDWRQAARLAGRTQLVLAGGLTAATVAAAITAVRPYGVDVSSGVEAAPGQKDPQRIVQFVQAARAAVAGNGHEHGNRN